MAFDINTNNLFLCLMGASGSGKSHMIGTYPGKVLYLYGSGESHGPASAAKNNSNIIAIPWDKTKQNGKPVLLDPAKAYGRLIEILSDTEALKGQGIECVAIDSYTNLVNDIKETPMFKQRCLSAKGVHNAFKEGEALIEMLSKVTRCLQNLSDFHGIDVIVPLDLSIMSTGANGEIIDCKPGLPQFGVAKAVVQQFPDILVLGRVGPKRTPVLQNYVTPKMVSKDADKQPVKYQEFTVRLKGVNEIPEELNPDLREILKLKGR